MPKSRTKSRSKSQVNPTSEPETSRLKGWKQISAFLGEPASVAQRWASTGMPVHREGRSVTVTPAEINDWLGKQTGKPVHVVTDETDLTSELKRGLSFLRKRES
ncbi:MAG TPA: hypothetical protein VGS27_33135 [Candidatus Sulfotelmatobacter sp.]|nr:hypothetical protein [Candidatus Sulfotelmatobacter sp.]